MTDDNKCDKCGAPVDEHIALCDRCYDAVQAEEREKRRAKKKLLDVIMATQMLAAGGSRPFNLPVRGGGPHRPNHVRVECPVCGTVYSRVPGDNRPCCSGGCYKKYAKGGGG